MVEIGCTFGACLCFLSGLPQGWNVLFMVVALSVGRFFWTGAHELGHVIGATVVGWQTIVVAVGRCAFQLPRRRFGLLPSDMPDDVGGFIVAIPKSRDVETSVRDILMTAAGPLANLFVAALLMALAWTYEPHNRFGHVEPDRLMLGFAWQSLAMFTLSAVPLVLRERANDGLAIWRTVAGKDSALSLTRMMRLRALSYFGVRLRDLPNWMIAECRASNALSAEDVRILDTIEIGRVLDSVRPDARKARTLIDAYHAKHAATCWSTSCEAFLAAVYEEDVAAAEAALEKSDGPTNVPQLELAAQAAIAMRRGRTEDAVQLLYSMDAIVRQEKPFRDLTYGDIRKTIEGLSASDNTILSRPARGLLRRADAA